jgi:hypothetical protein
VTAVAGDGGDRPPPSDEKTVDEAAELSALHTRDFR